ncbi:hypothetical protein GQ607_008061 [Colletotrichum asianum]|uniref:Uncharacterized protein n=1 Tax=Colletotrichum asianum TaxID=702518 RepID=A0A8H3ZR72_9PEZI|nr:hypothetical protein GQ607_008061 [Colletotrichum asianum]
MQSSAVGCGICHLQAIRSIMELAESQREAGSTLLKARSWLDMRWSSLTTRRLSMGLLRNRDLRELTVAYSNKDVGMSGDFFDLPKLPFSLCI